MMEIITGYTGTRHITPAMDAAIWGSIFNFPRYMEGTGNYYVLDYGGEFTTYVNSANEIRVSSGLLSMQGYIGLSPETLLPLDSCPSGYRRFDLLVCRFTHDVDTGIDNMELVVKKGREVQSPNEPTAPIPVPGVISDGATLVEMPLYKIKINGDSVSLERVCFKMPVIADGMTLRIKLGSLSSLPTTYSGDIPITGDHILADCYLTNPSAQTGEWTVTTEDRKLTLSGSINGTTTCYLTLVKANYLYGRRDM